jgi:AcrR family transcriptional regulator
MRAKLVLSPKKQPVQSRAVLTYQAIVSATARILERKGYDAVSTNQVARTAGVGIASVYEYFPGKHALVAAVVTELVDAVIRELGEGLENALATSGEDAVERWISLMFTALEKRRRLATVLVEEVPFLWQVPAAQSARRRLHDLSRAARSLYSNVPDPHVEGMTYLMPIMISNAVIEAVVREPKTWSPRRFDARSVTPCESYCTEQP